MRMIIAALVFTASCFLATNLHATVRPNAPKWYAAKVAGELYGPFRKPAGASKFCATVPASAGCAVVPIRPVSAWAGKGAR